MGWVPQKNGIVHPVEGEERELEDQMIRQKDSVPLRRTPR